LVQEYRSFSLIRLLWEGEARRKNDNLFGAWVQDKSENRNLATIEWGTGWSSRKAAINAAARSTLSSNAGFFLLRQNDLLD
jgi:hypothetical protein